MGEILDRIGEYGIRDNTIIIFQSDNGGDEPCGKQNWIYRGGKFNLLEGGIRVATLISWPEKLPQGCIYGYPVMNIDFLPTILDAAGIEPEQEMDGVNLLPFLKGEDQSRPHEALFWNERNQYAVRAGDWKLVFSHRGQGLFNLAEDPSEMHDLRGRYPDKARELQGLYDAWNQENIEIEPAPEEKQHVEDVRANAADSLKNWSYSHVFGDN
jgi:arylsulfatase A-like enzyme